MLELRVDKYVFRCNCLVRDDTYCKRPEQAPGLHGRFRSMFALGDALMVMNESVRKMAGPTVEIDTSF